MGIQDDFAREGRAREVMHLNQSVESALANWSLNWSLDRVSVVCRHCGGTQKISDSGEPFHDRHEKICTYLSKSTQHPIGDLANILSGWHLVLWDDEAEG